MLRVRRGFYCAVKGCMSKPNGTISFFYFPKREDRRLEWIRACSRPEFHEKDKNFLSQTRVCAKHFEERMFLNDFKNRLQPHAKPTLFLFEEEVLSATSVTPVGGPSCSEASTSDIMTEAIFSSTSTQTEKSLLANTPQKRKLRDNIKRFNRENKKLKAEHREYLENVSTNDFMNLCEKFLPPLTAKFVQAQVTMATQKNCMKQYPDSCKRFALQLYSISPKAYNFIRKFFMLPSARSLQDITHDTSTSSKSNKWLTVKNLGIF